MKVAIIGAGLSGLSAEYELSKKGIEVSIFESKDVGGLASSYYVNVRIIIGTACDFLYKYYDSVDI